jgi:metallo-beta-lactamase family protein
MNKFKLHFYGGTESVTGANFVLEKVITDNKTGESKSVKIMVDCGLTQGFLKKGQTDPNREPFKYNPSEIDFLIVTHAHADHIGLIPKLVKHGFTGEIYSTPTTKEITSVMFDDALSIIANDEKKKNLKPIYGRKDVDQALNMWNTVPYHQDFDLTDGLGLYFKDAGHILGSAIVYIKDKDSSQTEGEAQNFVFTGDLGNTPTPLIRNTETVNDADYLIMESVYGDRNHENREGRKERLKKVLNKVIERKGTLLIPVFSLEKTQVLLHEMNDLIEGGEVPAVPTFFDSPLGIRLTDIYAKQFTNFNEKVQERIKGGDDIFDFPKLIKTFDRKESAEIHKTPGPKIIIASSGMSVGGRILDHEKHYLSDPKNAILFIGYQVPGTIGRAIEEGQKSIRIDNTDVYIKAQIELVSGYSSHKDSDNLINFVADTAERVKKVFVVMGENKSAMFLTQKLRDNLGVNAVHPKEGDVIDL